MNIEIFPGRRGTFACHAHFPGATSRISFQSGEKKIRGNQECISLHLDLPSDSECYRGVSFVLLKKENNSVVSWYPYARCRVENLTVSKQTYQMKEENNNSFKTGVKLCVKSSVELSLKTKEKGTLIDEWFLVPKCFEQAIEKMRKEGMQWFKSSGGEEGTSDERRNRANANPHADERERKFITNTHMPYWNNNLKSLPGWFFAVDNPETDRYEKSIFQEVLCLAKIMLHFTNKEAAREEDVLLGLMLTVFGGSVRYGKDIAPGSGKGIERFSSLARNDGMGDCEDIAKESCMCLSELKRLEYSDESSELLHKVIEASKKYIPAILLVTVKSDDQMFAHAVCCLIPRSFFDSEGDSKDECLLCDGTYLCFPKYDCPLPDENCEGRGWSRPYEYRYVVSAMLCEPLYADGDESKEIREVYFSYDEKGSSYGVLLKHLCGRGEKKVHWKSTHEAFDEKASETIRTILRANRPIAGDTATGEWSVAERFTLLQRHRLKKLMGCSFPLVYPENGIQMLDRTLGLQEFTGFYDLVNKQYVETTAGFYAGVPRHCYSESLWNKPILYHNHHVNKDFADQKYNPPSHWDVLIFIAMRATRTFIKNRDAENPKKEKSAEGESALVKLEIVPEKDNVFEIVESVYLYPDAFDSCAYVIEELEKQQDAYAMTPENVYGLAHSIIRQKLDEKEKDLEEVKEPKKWIPWLLEEYVNQGTRAEGMFMDERACENYLFAYEEIGITIIRHSRKKRDEISVLCG